MRLKITIILISVFAFTGIYAQRRPLSASIRENSVPIEWNATAQMQSEDIGLITITAKIAKGWHLYGMNMPSDGPKPTRFIFNTSEEWQLYQNLTVDKAPETKFDALFNSELQYWSENVVFKQHFKINRDMAIPLTLKLKVSYMGCDDTNCLPPSEKEFNLKVTPLK